MTADLIVFTDNERSLFAPANANKNTRYRIHRYMRWMDDNGLHWWQPDIARYRDDLIDAGYKLATVRAYVSAVRTRYHDLLADNDVRDWLYVKVPPDTSASDAKAMVDEVLTRISNAANARNSKIKKKRVQDRPDSAFFWLSASQARELIAQPLAVFGDDAPRRAIRDTAIIALLLGTGLRKAEATALDVRNLYETLQGQPAVHVIEGKGNKDRLVVYGDDRWWLVYVQRWLDEANLATGRVFRSFTPHYKNVRASLDPSYIDQMLTGHAANGLPGYRVALADGALKSPTPHDLRRTYARNFFDAKIAAGMREIDALTATRLQLGHDSTQTTMIYLNLAQHVDRVPVRDMYGFDEEG